MRIQSHLATQHLKALFDLNPLERKLAMDYIETYSPDELLTYGTTGKPMSMEAINFSNELRTAAGLDDRHIALVVSRRTEAINEKITNGETTTVAGQKEIGEILSTANHGRPLSDPQLQVLAILLKIRDVPKETASLLDVTMYADALDNRGKGGALNRKEFAAKHSDVLTPEVIKATRHLELIYKTLADEFGIETPLQRYLPHMRKYLGGDITDLAQIRASRFLDLKQQDFTHLLARIGYMDHQVQIHDPIVQLAKYMNTGYRIKYLDPVIKSMQDRLDMAGMERFGPPTPIQGPPELPGETLPGYGEGLAGRPKYSRGEIQAFQKVVDHLKDQVNRFSDPLDRLADINADQHIKSLTGETIDRSRDLIREWNRWQEYKAQGFKPAAGIRDLTTTIQTYSYLLGPVRAAKFAATMREGLKKGRALQEAGKTAALEMSSLLGGRPDAVFEGALEGGKGLRERVGRNLNELQTKGFEMSGQAAVYRVSHAAAYIETTKFAAPLVQKLALGEITPEAFAKKLMLDLYDPGVRAEFVSKIKSNDWSGATDFLATRTAEMTVGQYGMFNNPIMFSTNYGRILGQFANWPLWELQNISRGLVAENKKAAGLRLAQLAATSGAAYVASKQLGLDFNNWSLNPFTMFPKLGPFGQLYTAFVNAGDPSSPTAAYDQSKFVNLIKYNANPMPLEFSKIIDATNRASQGDPLHVVAWDLMGGRVDSKIYHRPDFNFWDP
jgi:hypothetical protein